MGSLVLLNELLDVQKQPIIIVQIKEISLTNFALIFLLHPLAR
jgi:hypothetical protein